MSNNNNVTKKSTVKKLKKYAKKVVRKVHSPRGWAILFATFFFFIISSAAIIGPVSKTTMQLKDTQLEIALATGGDIALSTSGPIRNYIVDQVYQRVQTQLVDHLRKAQGSTSYVCQGKLTAPSSAGTADGDLAGQYGLCEPEVLFNDLKGDINQTINFLEGINLGNTTSDDKGSDKLRENIIRQAQNDYSYTLRATFVGQEKFPKRGLTTIDTEKYHWLVRADVESHSYDDITSGTVIYFDVVLTNQFIPDNFSGAGDACDRKEPTMTTCSNALIGVINGTGEDCISTGYVTPEGTFFPVGSGPCVSFSQEGCEIAGECIDVGSHLTCPLSNGGYTIKYRLKSTRAEPGCASLKTGNKSAIGLDPQGYSFLLTVRIVSIGSTYN
ncbi:MAG: hypothetical protein J0M03_03220 [Acidobacteria bacterium]|nr:hypothetical protein [Acidobacteriota bacterium]